MKQNRTRAFFVEAAVLALFLLLAFTVLVRVYGRSRQMGQQAADKTAAALILQNADAAFQAGAGAFSDRQPGETALYYAADGTEAAEADADYRVTAVLTQEPTDTGALLHAALTVARAEDGAEPLAELQTACFIGKGAA